MGNLAYNNRDAIENFAMNNKDAIARAAIDNQDKILENQDFLFEAADAYSEQRPAQSGELSYRQSNMNTTNPFDKTKN